MKGNGDLISKMFDIENAGIIFLIHTWCEAPVRFCSGNGSLEKDLGGGAQDFSHGMGLVGCSNEVHPMSNAIKVTRVLAREEAGPTTDPLITRPRFELKKEFGP